MGSPEGEGTYVSVSLRAVSFHFAFKTPESAIHDGLQPISNDFYACAPGGKTQLVPASMFVDGSRGPNPCAFIGPLEPIEERKGSPGGSI